MKTNNLQKNRNILEKSKLKSYFEKKYNHSKILISNF
jgi:hypothetical protein